MRRFQVASSRSTRVFCAPEQIPLPARSKMGPPDTFSQINEPAAMRYWSVSSRHRLTCCHCTPLPMGRRGCLLFSQKHYEKNHCGRALTPTLPPITRAIVPQHCTVARVQLSICRARHQPALQYPLMHRGMTSKSHCRVENQIYGHANAAALQRAGGSAAGVSAPSRCKKRNSGASEFAFSM